MPFKKVAFFPCVTALCVGLWYSVFWFSHSSYDEQFLVAFTRWVTFLTTVVNTAGGAATRTVMSRTLILIFTLTAITCAWVYQHFMGSTSTQPVTTGTNSFIINVLIIKDSLSLSLSKSSCPNVPGLLSWRTLHQPHLPLSRRLTIYLATTFFKVFLDPRFMLRQPSIHHVQSRMHSDTCGRKELTKLHVLCLLLSFCPCSVSMLL